MALRFPPIRDWTFWHYQAIGWPIFAFAHIAVNTAASGFSWRMFGILLLQVVAGFLLSLILREYFRRVRYHEVSLPSIIARVTVGALAMTTVWYGAYMMIIVAYNGTVPLGRLLSLQHAMHVIVLIYPEKLVWGALYFGIKFWRDWINERERAEKAEEEIRQAQLQTLRYQLNPHFLFNALNSLRALTDEDSQQARTMITELSEFLRYSLVHRNRTDVTLREEVKAIRHYLSIEKKRYEEKLEVTIDVQPEAEECPVLSFLIQPLVENAVKYGMLTSPLPLQIRVGAELIGTSLRISVVNTGRWLEPTTASSKPLNRTGAGLHNVQARLRHAFPQRHTFETHERNGHVIVAISIHYDHEIHHEEEVAGHYR